MKFSYIRLTDWSAHHCFSGMVTPKMLMFCIYHECWSVSILIHSSNRNTTCMCIKLKIVSTNVHIRVYMFYVHSSNDVRYQKIQINNTLWTCDIFYIHLHDRSVINKIFPHANSGNFQPQFLKYLSCSQSLFKAFIMFILTLSWVRILHYACTNFPTMKSCLDICIATKIVPSKKW